MNRPCTWTRAVLAGPQAWPYIDEPQWRCYICRVWNNVSSQVCRNCGRVR